MKRIAIGILALLTISCSGPKKTTPDANLTAELRNLYTNKQYFDLRDILEGWDRDSSSTILFYRGVVDNKFHRPESSVRYLQAYVSQEESEADVDLLIDGYEILADNFLKMHQYKEASEAFGTILSTFVSRLDPERVADFENSFTMCDALRDVPPQTAVIQSETKLQTTDGYLPVRINDRDLLLGPDTGANFSVIIRSLAEKADMRIIDVSVDVLNVAGMKVVAKLGVASRMEIGKVVLHNVVFLVFDDKDLYISGADIQIKGVIGFPVIEALGEITFGRNGEVLIPAEPRKHSIHNMCLDGLTPLIAGIFRGHRHTFCLDTGAGASTLYPPFFKAYEEEIKVNYSATIEKVRGFGGYREIPAYRMENVRMTFSEKEVFFKEIPVLTEYTLDNSHYFYGNLGRDMIHQFERMTLNFESMCIVFE